MYLNCDVYLNVHNTSSKILQCWQITNAQISIQFSQSSVLHKTVLAFQKRLLIAILAHKRFEQLLVHEVRW